MKKIHRTVLFKQKILTFPCVSTVTDSVYYYISTENKLIDKNEIEASRIIITRELRKIKALSKKKKNFWINVNFLLPYTKKSAQSRMGKGKGAKRCRLGDPEIPAGCDHHPVPARQPGGPWASLRFGGDREGSFYGGCRSQAVP